MQYPLGSIVAGVTRYEAFCLQSTVWVGVCKTIFNNVSLLSFELCCGIVPLSYKIFRGFSVVDKRERRHGTFGKLLSDKLLDDGDMFAHFCRALCPRVVIAGYTNSQQQQCGEHFSLQL